MKNLKLIIQNELALHQKRVLKAEIKLFLVNYLQGHVESESDLLIILSKVKSHIQDFTHFPKNYSLERTVNNICFEISQENIDFEIKDTEKLIHLIHTCKQYYIKINKLDKQISQRQKLIGNE